MRGGLATLRRIIGFSGPYKWLLLTGYLLISADVVFSVGIVAAVQRIIDAMAANQTDRLYKLLIFSSIVVFICVLLSMLGSSFRKYASVQTERRMSGILLSHVNSLPFSYFQENHTGDLVERVNSDAGKAAGVLNGGLVTLISNLMICASAFVYLSNIDIKLALMAAATGPVTLVLVRFFDRRVRRMAEDLNNKNGDLRSLLQEFLQAMPVVRVLGLEGVFMDKFTKQKDIQLQLTRKKAFTDNTMWRVIIIGNRSVSILLTFIIASTAIQGTMSVGAVMSFLVLLGRLQWPFVQISRTWGTIQNALGAADRVFKVLDMDKEEKLSCGNCKDMRHESCCLDEYAISMENVCFSYGGRTVFDHLNLRIRNGETVAVVGASGSGKTTLARLCCGLFIPESGDIRIYGRSTSTDLYGARRMLAYVPQMPYLFSVAVEENILHGIKQADCLKEGAVKEAAVLANADSFISEMQDGYKTVLKEQGSNLSGGQKQRITIARALAGDTPLLIFDEATSSLDYESEQLIRQTIDNLSGGKTMLIIAHRLSTVRNASRIVVLDDGRIVEEGTHNELMEAGGAYFRLYNEGRFVQTA